MGTPRRSGWLVLLLLGLLALVAPSAATAAPRHGHASAHLLVTGLQGGAGSTIGPDRALYVTETAAGRVTRVDPKTGATTTYASGLPKSIIGLGGAMDVAFLGRTA
jgi:streptogramin lyase